MAADFRPMEKAGMRVRLGNECHPHYGNRSYLDAADDIIAYRREN